MMYLVFMEMYTALRSLIKETRCFENKYPELFWGTFGIGALIAFKYGSGF